MHQHFIIKYRFYVPEFMDCRCTNPNSNIQNIDYDFLFSYQLLHSFGARKIAVFGVSGVGCAPAVVQKFGGNPVCSNKINGEVQLFNDRLQIMVNRLNKDLNGAKFTYVNVTSIFARGLPQLGNYLQ